MLLQPLDCLVCSVKQVAFLEDDKWTYYDCWCVLAARSRTTDTISAHPLLGAQYFLSLMYTEREEGSSMCGICGYTAHCENDERVIKAMCDVIAHRGPDGEGRSILNGAVFGHRRLSLIDLQGGGQPMFRNAEKDSPVFIAGARVDEERLARYAIVFNGEIYNYQDIRADLEALGYAFSTTSDTEVLLLSYIVWGEAMLDRLRGMFAFAIWDTQTQELFCARDFFGIKPFYYAEDLEGHFIFASEAKSILEHPSYTKELNHRALEDYLVFQFPANEETFFKGIYKLAPATFIRVKQGKVDRKSVV